MDNTFEIQIKGKTFKLGFGLEVFIKLGELWDLDALEDVNERFQVLGNISKDGKTSLKTLVVLSELIEGMVSANPENTETIKAIEVRSLPINELLEIITQLMRGYAKSLPKPDLEEQEAEKKPNPRGKNKSLSPGTL
jgi:hypothetical protein